MLGRLLVVVTLLIATVASAQEPPPVAPPAAPAEASPAVPPAPPAEEDVSDGVRWERTIYVPFRELQAVFQKEGDGVFVPRKEFEALWRKAMDRPDPATKPSSPYLVTRALYTGRVDGDLAVVTAEIDVETFRDGWVEVPLGLSGVALGEARLDGSPATLSLVKGAHRLLVPAAGKHRLDLEFVASIAEDKDGRAVSFGCPAVPVARLDFTVPGAGVNVTVDPNLATTRTDGEGETTRVLAYVGGAGKVSLRWKPKPVDLVAGDPLLLAETRLTATYGEGVLRTDVTVAYRILRAGVDRFVLRIPADVRVLFVEGKDLRDWSVEAEGDARRLVVSLHTPARDRYALAVTLETPAEDLARPLPVPEIFEEGVVRAQGLVVVRGTQDIQIRTGEAAGVFRLNLAQLPGELASDRNVLAFRFPAHPWSLPLLVERIRPRVTVRERTVVSITERKRQVRSLFDVVVTRAGIFQIVLSAPRDLEVVEVGPPSLVEDWRFEEDGDLRQMVVDLKGRQEGAMTLAIVAETDFAVGAQDDVDAALPLLTPIGAERFSGTVGVQSDEAFELKTSVLTAMDPLDPALAITRLAGQDRNALNLVMAFRHQDAARAGSVLVRRKQPEVSAESVTRVTVEENRALLRTDLVYTVRFAGVDRYRFTLPSSLPEADVVITASGLKEKTSREVDGRREWTVTTQSKVKGTFAVRIESHVAFDALEAGGRETVAVPAVAALDVVRERHWYAVTKDPVLEIEAEVDRVEVVDPRELPEEARREGAFLAFRTLEQPHRLTLDITRHDYVALLDTVINHMHIETKLSREGVAIHTATLALRSSGRQYLKVFMPAGAKIQEVSVGPRKERPRTDGSGEGTLIPLGAMTGEQVVRVRIVYRQDDIDMSGVFTTSFELQAPRFGGGGEGTPVAGTSWTIWLPSDVMVTGSDGNMSRQPPFTLREGAASWVRRALQRYLPKLRTDAHGVEVDVLRIAPDGVTRVGPRLEFSRAQGDAVVGASFASPTLFAVLAALFLLGSLAVGVLLPRRLAGRHATVCLSLVVLPFVFLAFAGAGWAYLLNAVLAGGILAGAYWIVVGGIRTVRVWAANRPEPMPAAAGTAPAPDVEAKTEKEGEDS